MKEAEKVALLQKSVRLHTLICSATLLVAVLLLRFTAQNTEFNARRWLMFSALVVAAEFWYLRRVLRQNHHPNSDRLYPDLGAANLLTIYRGLAYAWMAGFLLLPRPGGPMDWLPAILYVAASITDAIDGYVARKTDRVSKLGETLDMESDGLGVLVACMLAVQYGQLPLVFLLVGFARPLFVGGMLLRTRMGLPNYPMTESNQRRIIAGLLMIFLSTVLWPIFRPPETYVVGAVFGGAVTLSFVRDWLVNIGWISPGHLTYRIWRARLNQWSFLWIPVGLRILAAALTSLLVVELLSGSSDMPAAANLLIALVGALGGAAVLLGVATRSAAGLVSLASYLGYALAGQAALGLALLFISSLLIVLGSGQFTLWIPEERWLRIGAIVDD
ncbi:MAG: CDP-alcohol phosphatidyltransferase family protein [Caldilineaceae bacterium]|nr:CDP-alcohol phosphatidyltransferase family protein [Caldilineaceae bacterium]